jgi:hypothetical protein
VLFALLKKEGERREEGGERKIFIPLFKKIYMSSPCPPLKFLKFKRGMNSILRSLSRIRYPPLPFLHSLPSLLFYLPLIHYIPYIPYTCIS